MKPTDRYVFEHIVVDVEKDSKGNAPLIQDGEFGLIWMTPDEGKDHKVLSFEKFHDLSDLELAESGLKVLQQALVRNEEFEDGSN